MEESSINLTETIKNSLSEIFSSLFSSVDNNIYSLLDEITFISPKITKEPAISKLLGENISERLFSNLQCTCTRIYSILLY